MKQEDVLQLIEEQFREWPVLHERYAALGQVRVKELDLGEMEVRVQFNPARVSSSSACIDRALLNQRPCFLCDANRPKEQRGLPWGRDYQILVNPFPIFPHHLTIPDLNHTPQRIEGRLEDMMELARQLTDFTIFYNGPRCGASAPDHAHFQAGNRGFMPIEADWKNQIAGRIADYGKATLYYLNDQPRTTLVIQSADMASANHLFSLICRLLPEQPEGEPMLNLLAMYDEGVWTLFVFPRAKHRPACYTAEGDARLLSSPASVDLGGVFITPVEADFHKISPAIMEQILSEVCLSASDFAKLRQDIKNHLC